MAIEKEDKLTLKVWENDLYAWCFVVFTGDGSLPGSLLAGAGGNSLEEALQQGQEELEQWVAIRACEHDWVRWRPENSTAMQCNKCKIVRFESPDAA